MMDFFDYEDLPASEYEPFRLNRSQSGGYESVPAQRPWIPVFEQILVRSPEWMQDGQCHQDRERWDVFVPDRGTKHMKAPPECATCPVRQLCKDYGEEVGAVGWWGGEYRKLEDNKGDRRRKVAA